MTRFSKKISIWLTFMFVLSIFTTLSSMAQIQNPIKVIRDGKEIKFDVEPYIKNGRVMVPFRLIMEDMGFYVEWDEKEKSVKAIRDADEILFKVNNINVNVNSKEYKIDAEPEMKNGRTFVPVRFLAEHSGENVAWYGDKTQVAIKSNMYKANLGEQDFYKEMRFIVEKVNKVGEFGYEVLGKISTNTEDVVISLIDNVGRSYSGVVQTEGKSGNMYSFKTLITTEMFDLPTIAKIKIIDKNGENFVASEYILANK